MLTRLYIQNYALLKNLEIAPARELNIITGETGAGKSILLGAIGLLLGNRADSKALLDSNNKCIIEGIFDLSKINAKELFDSSELDEESECIIRREINAAGKSRAFINDTPVTLDVLKQWGEILIDIHSQHDTLLLGNEFYQMRVVDTFSNAVEHTMAVSESYKKYKAADTRLHDLQKKAAEFQKQFDYDSFILNELEEVNLEKINQDALESELKKLENAEQIKSKIQQLLISLQEGDQSALQQLTDARKISEHLKGFSSGFEQLQKRLLGLQIELKDIINEYETEGEQIQSDNEKITQIQDTLNRLYKLQTKHHVSSTEALIALRNELQNKIALVTNIESETKKAEQERTTAYKDALKKAETLRLIRQKAAPELSHTLESLLKDIGMPNASLRIAIDDTPLHSKGIDTIKFLFSANKGIPPQELKNAASGGEFSRLMLAIKYILAEGTNLPTLVFDEIDTGISGEVAIKVGQMIARMAEKHQIFAITHLPQMASLGKQHYFVYKDHSGDTTTSSIKLLNKTERIAEIAQMIGGSDADNTAIKAAEKLLQK